MLINQVTRLMRMQRFWHTISIIIWYSWKTFFKRCAYKFFIHLIRFSDNISERLKMFFISFLMSNSHHVGPWQVHNKLPVYSCKKKKYAAAQKPALPNNSFSHSPSITTTGNWLERAALGTISRQKLAEFGCSLSW